MKPSQCQNSREGACRNALLFTERSRLFQRSCPFPGVEGGQWGRVLLRVGFSGFLLGFLFLLGAAPILWAQNEPTARVVLSGTPENPMDPLRPGEETSGNEAAVPAAATLPSKENSASETGSRTFENAEAVRPSNQHDSSERLWVAQNDQKTPAAHEVESVLPPSNEAFEAAEKLLQNPEQWTSPDGITSSLGMICLITVISLAPAILIMTTSFVRIVTVLSILRQALGTGQLPPGQVLTALALFLTLLIMTPVWLQVYDRAVVPYANHEIGLEEAWQETQQPIRSFMCQQIERTGNTDSIWLFMQYIPDAKVPEYYEDVPLRALLPAFMLTELKTAFLIGFQLFIPFLIIDMIVAGIMVSMGMMMLPPVMISLPFKLLLFVLMDGWTLVVKMLLDSFMGV